MRRVLLACLSASCADAGPRLPFDLVDEAEARGLSHANRSGGPKKATILEANGAGVALLDLERDGDLDVVLAQGLSSLTELCAGGGTDIDVFLNDGAARFTRTPGPGLSGWWTGLATGDVDGDGDADLVAGGFGRLVVLVQQDGGELAPAAELVSAPSSPAPPWITSLALFDADRDGHLDLYAGLYLDLDPCAPPLGALGDGALAVPCEWKGLAVYCGPRGLSPQADRMWRGRGDGSFEELDPARLGAAPAGYTLAVAPFDADGDGDTDLAVAADSSPNLLLIGDGAGAFRELAYAAGVALGADGRPQAGMGIAVGDVDRDGRFDLAITNFSDEPTELHLGADVGFTQATYRYGLSRETQRLLSWSAHLADFDGDGWLELFTANGHVYPQADEPNTGTSYGQPDTLWHLGPEPRARPAGGARAGSLLAAPLGSRGSALGDLDGDGAPDLVVTRIDGPTALGLARGGAARRLAVRCLGPRADPPGARSADPTGAPRTPADGMGTRLVLVVAATGGEFALLDEVQTARGYQSASTPWSHFGLGERGTPLRLFVCWPSTREETLEGLRAGERIWIREGEGIVRREELR